MCDRENYPLVARAGKAGYENSLRSATISVGDAVFGADLPCIIAGPCAVESREHTLAIAREVKKAGADCLRGGAFKPRTSPYSFQGLGQEGLEILAEARDETGLPVVTEVMDVRLVDLVCEYADMLQIGSRNMQNFPLLIEVGKAGKPVLLKRGMSATIKEWLCAAEYIALSGSAEILLVERGVRCSVSRDYARNTLDLNVIIPTREETVLPVLADPSHSTGRADLVPWVSRAAISAGAQGLIIEVIGEDMKPEDVRCDGAQSIRPSVLRDIVNTVKGPVSATAV